MKTIVLLSGGLDSATVLAMCRADLDQCFAVGFDYDQPHKIELDRARTLAMYYNVPFDIYRILTMPKVDDVVFAGRNLVMASIAIALARELGYDRIAVGSNASDWKRFPDCRPGFWTYVASAAQAYDVKVFTPLMHLSKSEVVERALKLNVPIEKTWSCYSPGPMPCGQCLACTTRQEALA